MKSPTRFTTLEDVSGDGCRLEIYLTDHEIGFSCRSKRDAVTVYLDPDKAEFILGKLCERIRADRAEPKPEGQTPKEKP